MPEFPYHTPLAAPALRDLGIPEPWSFGLADRVRFGELDALGHVNHTAYLRWFESFRLPFLQARKVTDYGADAPRLVLKQVECTYLAEMFMGQDYIVTGRVSRFRTTSFTMEYSVWLPGDTATETARGGAVIVLLNRDKSGRCPIPEEGRRSFVEEDHATSESEGINAGFP